MNENNATRTAKDIAKEVHTLYREAWVKEISGPRPNWLKTPYEHLKPAYRLYLEEIARRGSEIGPGRAA